VAGEHRLLLSIAPSQNSFSKPLYAKPIKDNPAQPLLIVRMHSFDHSVEPDMNILKREDISAPEGVIQNFFEDTRLLWTQGVEDFRRPDNRGGSGKLNSRVKWIFRAKAA
jgi:hypothetical protein